MEGAPKIDTEEYLEKMEKTDIDISAEELLASDERLRAPFEKITRRGDITEISVEGVKIYIRYRPYVFEKDGVAYVDPKLKYVSQFICDVKGTPVDIIGLMPFGTQILVDPDDTESGNILAKDKHGKRMIVISKAPESPKMMAILLHEVGHIIDLTKLDELGLDSLTDDHTNADIAENIRRERVAHAFMFKVMRPFLKDAEQRKDLINVAKYGALGGYYITARQKIRERKMDEQAKRDHYFADAAHYYGVDDAY